MSFREAQERRSVARLRPDSRPRAHRRERDPPALRVGLTRSTPPSCATRPMVDQDPSIASTTLMGRSPAGGRPRTGCGPPRDAVPSTLQGTSSTTIAPSHILLLCGRSALSRDASDRCSIGLRQRSARLTIDVPAACPRCGVDGNSVLTAGLPTERTWMRRSRGPARRSAPAPRSAGVRERPRARLERHQTSVQHLRRRSTTDPGLGGGWPALRVAASWSSAPVTQAPSLSHSAVRREQ